MKKEEMKIFATDSVKANLEEVLLSASLHPLDTDDKEKELCLGLIHKLPNDIPLTVDEAYYLTRSVPTKEPLYTQIKETFVYPYISEAEIYRRDLAEGDLDTMEDLINDVRTARKRA